MHVCMHVCVCARVGVCIYMCICVCERAECIFVDASVCQLVVFLARGWRLLAVFVRIGVRTDSRVCVCVCFVFLFAFSLFWLCVCVCMCVRALAFVSVCPVFVFFVVCVCVCMGRLVSLYLCVYVCMHACLRTCLLVCVRTFCISVSICHSPAISFFLSLSFSLYCLRLCLSVCVLSLSLALFLSDTSVAVCFNSPVSCFRETIIGPSIAYLSCLHLMYVHPCSHDYARLNPACALSGWCLQAVYLDAASPWVHVSLSGISFHVCLWFELLDVAFAFCRVHRLPAPVSGQGCCSWISSGSSRVGSGTVVQNPELMSQQPLKPRQDSSRCVCVYVWHMFIWYILVSTNQLRCWIAASRASRRRSQTR